MSDDKSSVLVVDDEPINLDMAKEMLSDTYTLYFANQGLKAIEIAKDRKPDLILLDIMMPGIDGYETCRRLKEDPDTQKIPVIFFSALNRDWDETKGFNVGGADFIVKPASPEVVYLRVHTHIELKKARDELIKQNEILKENSRLRDDIDRITRHDLKGPLMSVINYPSIISKRCDLPSKIEDMLSTITRSGYKLLNMINLSLDLYKMEQGIYQFTPTKLNLIPVLEEIVIDNDNLCGQKDLSILISKDGQNIQSGDCYEIYGEQLLVYSMFSNLIKNAVEASPRGKTISVRLDVQEENRIRIHNHGVIPSDIRDRFFEKFVTSGKDKGTGLGTYSAKLIADTHKGIITFETNDEFGTEITIRLPLHPVNKL